MNTKDNYCCTYSFNFAQPTSLREIFFQPRFISFINDASVGQRVQRWLIDYGDFVTRIGKSLDEYKPDFHRPDTIDRCKLLLLTYISSLGDGIFVDSLGGRIVQFVTFYVILRTIDLLYRNLLDPIISAMIPQKFKWMNFVLNCAYIGFASLITGYQSIVILPLVLETFISWGWSNFFKGLQTLSRTKDFEIKDFIIKNLQTIIIDLLLPTFYLFRILGKSTGESIPASIEICSKSNEDVVYPPFLGFMTNHLKQLYLVEFFVPVLTKVLIDLICILILKVISQITSKDIDLRDPFGPLLSNFRPQVSSDIDSYEKYDAPENKKKKRRFHSSLVYSKPFSGQVLESQSKTPPAKTDDSVAASEKTGKIKTKGKGDPKFETKLDNGTKKLSTRVTIKVGAKVLKFKKMEGFKLMTDVWGVIISGSLTKEGINTYERSLFNGCFGGSIRQLKGFGDRYELRSGMDPRLIGKRYDGSALQALLNYMSYEEALAFSQELQRRGINDKVSMIVYCKEARKHEEITRVARSI